MREPDSAWVATAATNPAVVGQVSVRALAQLLAGEDPGHNIIVQPALITQKDSERQGHQEHGRPLRQAAAIRPCRRRDAEMDAAAKRQVNCPEIYGATPFTPSGHNRDRGSLAAAPLPARLLLICRPPDGRGRHPTANVPGDFAADRGTTAATATSASMKRTIAIHSAATDGRSASKCQRK